MPHYQIEQTATGVILWEGEADSHDNALDRLAQAAGYADYASIPEEAGGGDTLRVTETTADA